MPLTIIGWNEKYENNRTRELKRMDWVPVPNRMDGSGFRTLMAKPRGAALFGVWVLLLEIASKCEPRGSLTRSPGLPHTPESISLLTGVSPKLIRQAIEVLCHPEIGWIENISEGDHIEPPARSADADQKRRAHGRMDRALKSSAGVITPLGQVTERPSVCQWCSLDPGSDALGVTNIRAHHYLPYGEGANDVTVIFVCRSCHGCFESGKYTTSMILERFRSQVTPDDIAGDCLRVRAGVPFPSVPFNSVPFASEEKKDAPILRGHSRTDLSPPPPVAFQRWELDEQYCQFRASYEASGMVPSPADWADGYASWGALDWEQRLKAIDHARSADGAFIRLPWKYLRFHDWERKARPPAKPASPKEKPMADQLRELGYGD